MPQRVRLVLIGAFACLFAALAGTWIAAYRSAGDSPRVRDTSFSGAIRPPGARVPDFALRDQDGATLRTGDLRGDTTVFAFIYSRCDDVCPLEVQQIRGALDRLGHDVQVVGVSVDPAGDTPRRARAFLVEQHMTGRMRFLLGRRDQLEPVWKAFGIATGERPGDHSAYVVVADGQGRQRLGYPVSQLSVDGLARDLAALERS